jgi:hypothetical protein
MCLDCRWYVHAPNVRKPGGAQVGDKLAKSCANHALPRTPRDYSTHMLDVPLMTAITLE